MKTFIFSGFVLLTALSFSSCKKCSTCTFSDPEKGTITSEDVCQKGKQYRLVLEAYENNGWSCEKKK